MVAGQQDNSYSRRSTSSQIDKFVHSYFTFRTCAQIKALSYLSFITVANMFQYEERDRLASRKRQAKEWGKEPWDQFEIYNRQLLL